MQDFHELVRVCRDRKVYIQTHNFPDPDAIASAFGLQRLLAHYDISTTLCYEGRIDKLSTVKMLSLFDIQMHSYDELCRQMKEEDAIICVDSQKNGGNITDFIGDEIACIDHHPTFVPIEYQYADIQITGACATLIAKYYQTLGITPEQKVATALLYGLRMDTLRFSRGVTQMDIDMFAYLFPLCNQDVLFSLERNQLELPDLRAYGAAIDNISVYGEIGISGIPFSCPDGLVAALSDFILSLEEVTVAVVFCCRKDGIKFSARSEVPEIHAGYLLRDVLAGLGDGGGHQEMAGGFVKKEKAHLLGQYPENLLHERILAFWEKHQK